MLKEKPLGTAERLFACPQFKLTFTLPKYFFMALLSVAMKNLSNWSARALLHLLSGDTLLDRALCLVVCGAILWGVITLLK